jgi:hypothetical protein
MHLKRLRKRRLRLLSTIESQPAMLGLVTSGMIDDAALFKLFCGRLDQARRVVHELQLTLALADCDPSAERPGKPPLDLKPPSRVLHKSRRGKPRSQEAFRQRFRDAVRYARALERINLIPVFHGPMAYLDNADLQDLLPGIAIPRNLRRQKFLVRLRLGHKAEPSVLEVFSTAGTPLFLHPLPQGFLAFGSDQTDN